LAGARPRDLKPAGPARPVSERTSHAGSTCNYSPAHHRFRHPLHAWPHAPHPGRRAGARRPLAGPPAADTQAPPTGAKLLPRALIPSPDE